MKNNKDYSLKARYSSEREKATRLERVNTALRHENAELKAKIRELEEIKMMGDEDIKSLLEKHRQIAKAEEHFDRIDKALNGSLHYITWC